MKTSHIRIGRAVLAGLGVNIASFIVGGGGYHLFSFVFRLEPRDIWKWTPESTIDMPASWLLMVLIVNTALAILFALVFAVLEEALPGRGIQKGVVFGFLIWLVGILPVVFTLYALTIIHPGALLYFTLQGLIEYGIYGALVAAIYITVPKEPLKIDAIQGGKPFPTEPYLTGYGEEETAQPTK